MHRHELNSIAQIIMRPNHSIRCVVDDNYQLWVSEIIARSIFRIDHPARWMRIDNFPEIIQVYDVFIKSKRYIIALTKIGQLLVVSQDYPKSTIIELSTTSIKYIHSWGDLIIIDNDHRIYRCPIERLIVNGIRSPILLGDCATSIASYHGEYLLWLDELGMIRSLDWYDHKTRMEDSPCHPKRLIGQFMIDVDNNVYSIRVRCGKIIFTKLFNVPYSIKDIAYNRKNVMIIDDDGCCRTYCQDDWGKVISYDSEIKRFIIDACWDIMCVEDRDGEVGIPEYYIDQFKLLNLEEHYS